MITVEPAALPVTTPPPVMLAADGILELHVPPVSALLSVIELPTHIAPAPVIAAGLVVIVINLVAIHAALIV